MQWALMLSRVGQCGQDTARASQSEVENVAMMDRPQSMAHMDLSESILYSASTLHLHGLPFKYASFESLDLLATCPAVCKATLLDLLCPEPLHKRLFTWQAHMGRCGGVGKGLHEHEVVTLAIKRMALSNPDPCGVAVPSSQLLLDRAAAFSHR